MFTSPTTPTSAVYLTTPRTVEANQTLREAGNQLLKLSQALDEQTRINQDLLAAAERGRRVEQLVKLSQDATRKGLISAAQVPAWILQRVDEPTPIERYREQILQR
jgi:hypothetical protein